MKPLSLGACAAIVAAATAALLAIPLVAMRFTPEVNWGAGDFLAAAALLGTAGMAGVLLWRRVRRPALRALGTGAVLLLLAAVWAERAVGLLT